MSSAPGVTAADWLSRYPPPRSLTLDQEAQRVYLIAYSLGIETQGDDPPISFTTVAAALLAGDDETSRWFAQTSRELGPHLAAVLAEKDFSEGALARAKAQTDIPSPESIRLSSDQQLLTGSSRAVLESAENWAQRVGGTDIGVRHLVAAYVLNPPAYHREQLSKKWKMDDGRWREVFFDWIGQRFTFEQWTDASQRATPGAVRVAFEQPQVKGRSLDWPGDEQALKVLDTAARIHMYRDPVWLQFSSLVYALAQRTESDPELRQEVLPFWTAVKESKTFLDVQGHEVAATELKPFVPFADLDLSPRVLNTLEAARALGTAVQSHTASVGTTVKVRPLDLVGALVSRRVDADEDLTALGFDVPALRAALLAHAEGLGDPAGVWREMLGEEDTWFRGRAIELNSDEPEAVIRLDEQWTNDPLAIRPDVEAFAALLASRDLEPPLSIGLFGPWGSGKTTFLKRLRRAVQSRADEARQPGATPGPYVSNVVHVEFNAWHFAEEALVSSLVDVTIRQIRAYVQATPDLGPKGWLEEKLQVLESRKRQVKAAEDVQAAAAKAVADTQAQLAVREREAASQVASVKNAILAVWAATKTALTTDPEVQSSGVLGKVGESVQDLQDLRQRVDRLRSRPGRMLADLGWARSLFFAGVVLIVPLLVAMAVVRVTGTLDFRALLSAFTTTVVAIGFWAKTASAAVAKVDAAVDKVVVRYEQEIAADKGVIEAQTALKTAQAGMDTAAAALQACRDELARAQTDAANASLPAQTLQLVSSRIDDRSYAKELTTLSLARADLETLSQILRAQRTDTNAVGSPLRTIDRVILYIDDLDRCRPEDVVRVLQLVHMLLAFELFVVVVAVDARWVEQALKQSYPWLSKSAVRPTIQSLIGTQVTVEPFEPLTPEDYLEKIFQIAFWLEPMTATRAAQYLTSLVRPPMKVAASASSAAPGAESDTMRIDISTVELDYMRALSAYVGSSPRRVKRLVNAYRLIKARLTTAQLRRFVTDRGAKGAPSRSGPYQIVIGLLVIGTGAQEASSAILNSLAQWHPGAKYVDVVQKLREKNDPDWTIAALVIETLMRAQDTELIGNLRGWAGQVGRFLLHGPNIERAAPNAQSPTSKT